MTALLEQIAADVGAAFFDPNGFAEVAVLPSLQTFRAIVEDDPDDRVAFVHVASDAAILLSAGATFTIGARSFSVQRAVRYEVGIVTFVCKVTG